MRCNYCGQEISDSSKFCQNCGAKVEEGNSSPDSQSQPDIKASAMPEGRPKNESASPLEKEPDGRNSGEGKMGMKWHKFLIYFYLWIAGAGSILSGFQGISGNLFEEYASFLYTSYPGLRTLTVVYGVASIFVGILVIVARFQLARYDAKGPKNLVRSGLLSLVIGIAYLIIASILTNVFMLGGSTIVSSVITLLYTLFNYNYYDDRRHMFQN